MILTGSKDLRVRRTIDSILCSYAAFLASFTAGRVIFGKKYLPL